MDYAKILKAIKAYNAMTPAEVQETIKPIIKSWNVEFLAEKLGITPSAIYQMCKKCYVVRGMKPNFESYVILMNLGTSPEPKERKARKKKELTAEEIAEARAKRKEYQKRYYQRKKEEANNIR